MFKTLFYYLFTASALTPLPHPDYNSVLFVVTSHDKLGSTGKKTGAFLSEITHPYEEFIKLGYNIDIASPKGGVVPLDGLEINDEINKKYLNDKDFKKKISNSLKLKNIDIKKYKAIFFAGGHGTMFDFPNDKDLSKIAGALYDSGGVIGAVCHGPSALVNIKLKSGEYLVKGKKVAGFSNSEEEAVKLTSVMPFLLESKLKELGGIYSKAPDFEKHAVKDERLVTGQNPASASEVAKLMIETLRHKSK